MKGDDFSKGWDFFVNLAAADTAYKSGNAFAQQRISAINEAINEMEYRINNHPHRFNTQATFQGYVAEEWSAGTFNVNAAAAGSTDRATAIQSNDLGSVDVHIDSGKDYSMKSYANGAKSAVEQTRIDPNTGQVLYEKQGRWVPADQLNDAMAEAHRRMIKDIHNDGREYVGEAYADTEANLTDRISNDEGIESNPATRKQLNKMASEGKEQKFRAEDYDISANSALNMEYVLQEALKAGYTAASLTFAFQMAPEIYKCIDYLIKNGEIDVNQLKEGGLKAVSSSATGFINGFLSSSLTIMAEKGAFGEALKNVSGAWVGLAVSILAESIKDSVRLANGQITAREMGSALMDRVAVGVTFTVVGTKVVSAISGAIAQAIGWQLPAVSYIIGSLVGCAISAVYNFGKKKFLSICVDTGFTCFGLVDQNYEMPVEYLKSIGIEVVFPDFASADIEEADFENADYEEADYGKLETIEFHELKRGIIGVNKIGYVMAS